MELLCKKESLWNAVSLADRVSGKNLTLQILSTILLIAKKSELIIRSTNLDLGIEIKINAQIKKEGEVAISGSILNTLLSNINNENITLELDNNNLKITTKNTSTIIKSYPHDDFPILPTISKKESLILPKEKLLNGLKSVYYSASISDIKPEISSVFIMSEGDIIIFSATDSFRLAEKKITLVNNKNFSLIIPFKNVSEIIKILDNNDDKEDVLVNFNNNQISFKINNIFITSRLIDGIFPDYKQILPKEFSSEVIVLKQDLLNAIKVTNTFSDKFNKIEFNIKPSKNKFSVYSKNKDIGENRAIVDSTLSGDDVVLSFNYKYILDSFQSLKQDSISLHFNKESQPMVIKNVGDDSFLYLVMPLNQ